MMPSSSHKSQALYLLVAVTALGAIAAGIPAPPWAARGTGPTSKLDVVTYAAQVRPLLPDDVRAKLDAASNAAPSEIAMLLYEARLRSAVSWTTTNSTANTVIDTNRLDIGDYAARLTQMHSSNSLWSSRANKGQSTAYNPPASPWQMANVTSTAERIAALRYLYGTQWNLFTDSNSVQASLASAVASMTTGFHQLEELERRVGDVSDQLLNLDRYTNVFMVDGAAMSLFWHAYKMCNEPNPERARNLLMFLTQPADGNSFVRGSSYHFLGKILADKYQRYEDAFKCELMVHKFNACLVFTANAYINAATILEDIFLQHDNAMALFAVDVPTPEYREKCVIRHLAMADICFKLRDWTNTVRHLQVAQSYNPNSSSVGFACSNMGTRILSLWSTLATSPWTRVDAQTTIEAGLSQPVATPDDQLFWDALSHDWPPIDMIPKAILTNRVLCNNLFPNKAATATNTVYRRRPTWRLK